MNQLKHSEVAAKLALEGVVAALAGNVKGKLGLTPTVLTRHEKIDLGMDDTIDALYYRLDDGGVLFQSDGMSTTIWYGGGDYTAGVNVLDAMLKRLYPQAKQAKDEPHISEANYRLRTYDVKLPNNTLAVIDAIYPGGHVESPRFMIRITAMARQN